MSGVVSLDVRPVVPKDRYDRIMDAYEGLAPGETLDRSGRNGRTLLKSGPLRVTLVVMSAGGEIPEHNAEGPITVHVLDGTIRFSAGGQDHDIRAGGVLTAGPGVAHHVSSRNGGAFLLTVVQPEEAGQRGESA